MLSVNKKQQTARLQKGYSACAEGKNQWKFPRVTVIVTVKPTGVNMQTTYCLTLSDILSETLRFSLELWPSLWHIVVLSDILWHTLALSDILWHCLTYSETLSGIPAALLSRTLAHSDTLRHALPLSLKPWNFLTHSGTLALSDFSWNLWHFM